MDDPKDKNIVRRNAAVNRVVDAVDLDSGVGKIKVLCIRDEDAVGTEYPCHRCKKMCTKKTADVWTFDMATCVLVCHECLKLELADEPIYISTKG